MGQPQDKDFLNQGVARGETNPDSAPSHSGVEPCPSHSKAEKGSHWSGVVPGTREWYAMMRKCREVKEKNAENV